MTKAAMCLTCQQIIGPEPRENGSWIWCAKPCVHTGVRWRDPHKGHLEVTSLHGPQGVAVIGLHNGFFNGLVGGPRTHEFWRALHERMTQAPGYLFDKSRRDCWAVLIRPGESNDVFFIPYGEATEEPSIGSTP